MIRAVRLSVAVVALCLITSASDGQAIDLTVDQSQSSVTISILGTSDTSSITGTGSIELTPPSEPFSAAQLTAMDLTLADGFSIVFFGGLVTAGSDPGSVEVFIVNPGPAGTVDGSNQFDQLGNEAGFSGVVDVVDPFNLVGGTQTIILDDLGTSLLDIVAAQLEVDGGELTVSIGVDLEVPVSDTITATIVGSVVMTGTPATSVLETAASVSALQFSQRPNPVFTQAAFEFTAPRSGPVFLRIFSAAGRLVATPANGVQAGGSTTTVVWDLRSADGARVPAGVYFAQLEAGGVAETRRLVVTR